MHYISPYKLIKIMWRDLLLNENRKTEVWGFYFLSGHVVLLVSMGVGTTKCYRLQPLVFNSCRFYFQSCFFTDSKYMAMWRRIKHHGYNVKHEHIHSQNPQNTKCAEAAGVFFFSDSNLEDKRMSKVGSWIILTKAEQFMQRIYCE